VKLWPMPVIAVESRTRVVMQRDVATWNVHGGTSYNGSVYWRWANQRRFYQYAGPSTDHIFRVWSQ
jgi:hypothetical protein